MTETPTGFVHLTVWRHYWKGSSPLTGASAVTAQNRRIQREKKLPGWENFCKHSLYVGNANPSLNLSDTCLTFHSQLWQFLGTKSTSEKSTAKHVPVAVGTSILYLSRFPYWVRSTKERSMYNAMRNIFSQLHTPNDWHTKVNEYQSCAYVRS